MAITTRQTSLLVQQDWTKLYQTFRNADFQSYDYETLRKSMIDYLRTYYPEDFNDFTESSEYIALIDLIAFLGQSLAFRSDLNARENFIDTAERRDSILKLAKLISYNPKRNIPASGFLKINSVSTTESITDSNGLNLSNLLITWNDAANENWLEQFTSIVNASLVSSQVVGKPGASQVINGITNDEYSISIVPGVLPVYRFNASVEGINMPFEAVSATSYNENFVYERDPKPSSTFNLLFKNDNQGNGSANTGMFVYFKQGELKSLDFTLNDSLPNRVANINFDDINNTDVWLYPLTSQNIPGTKWKQVPAIGGLNVVFNQESDRNLYQVNTRANDQIDLVFGDGAFANIPQGNFRLYYRQSNGLNYKITPDEMQSVSLSISYVSRTNRIETLTISASLNYTVANSSAKESINDIRSKAPQQYYTQNRMITGEDYNTLPFTSFNNVLKVKTVNRASSGISRFLDVIDGSGKYSSTNIFADDGLVYKHKTNTTTSFTYNTVSEVNKVIYNIAKPMIASKEVSHLYYETATKFVPSITAIWNKVNSSSGISTGYFNAGTNIGTGATGNYQYFTTGALVKFVPPTGYYFNKNNQLIAGTPTALTDKMYIFAAVNSTSSPTMAVSQDVPTGSVVEHVVPVFKNDWPSSLISSIANQILANKNFGVRYDIPSTTWTLIPNTKLDMGSFDLSTANSDNDTSWMLAFTYNNGQYTISQRNLYYYVQSVLATRFYFDPKVKTYDSNTGLILKDQIKVLKVNSQPDSAAPLGTDITWYVYNAIVQPDGYQDTQKILVTFPDSNNDGIPDDPTLFDTLIAPSVNANNKFVYFKQVVDYSSFINYQVVDAGTIVSTYPGKNDISLNASLYSEGQVFYAYAEDAFYVVSSGLIYETSDYIARIGRQDLHFQYRHNSPNNRRIDPSPNNIMDLYILTKEYNTQYTAWIRDTSNKVTQPVAPTTEELRIDFGSLENLKALSDTIIYNPAKFKPIFGTKAVPELRATFKIVKNPNITVSDNDIKAQVISAINSYFDITNWEFGETFYFSELSAYLHNKLTPNVSSIIIVPSSGLAKFGSLYQINAEPNEIIVSAATVDNIEIINAITAAQLNQTAAGLNIV